ncbi:hypothetical protein AB0P21_04515 [Kribbella sp. NPDC056861]|uniref:hypothetical protein n=1 Tax=Kribbella sp. NPDC056861 TaxID=3154857 RepID=UPI00342FF5EF
MVDLKAYYAENRRRGEIAKQEFAARTHGWRFGLSPSAAAWAAGQTVISAGQPTAVEAWLTELVRAADAAGVFAKPEPGQLRTAFASRDPLSEETTGIGFGFWPSSAEYLVVHGSAVVAFTELGSTSAYDVLAAVVESLGVPRARSEQA